MSDNLRTTGRIEFDPPLPWATYRDFLNRTELPSGDSRDHSILIIEESIEQVQTDDGELTRRTAVAIVPRYTPESYGVWGKSRHLAAELEELREWLIGETESCPHGHLITDKSDIGGIERWSIERTSSGFTREVENWRVIREAAVMIWPSDATSAVEQAGQFWRYTADGKAAVNDGGQVIDLQVQPDRFDS